jgi:hypothetical protein
MKTKSEHYVIEPEQLHKKQTLLQVFLPIIAVGVVCLFFFILLLFMTSAKPQSTEQWAQISTIFLIFPAIFLGLVLLAVLVFLSINTVKWNNNWPPVLKNFRLAVIGFEKTIQGLIQKPAQIVITIKSAFTGILAIFKK